MQVLTQEIYLPNSREQQLQIHVRREDLLWPGIPGNKYRKLKYNLQEAKSIKAHTLLTFGGAYSNHIAAVAHAGKENGFKTIGIIRGEELRSRWKNNPTLALAGQMGMEFNFVSRGDYRKKHTAKFLSELAEKYGNFYHIPEGGTNALAVKGCEEILSPEDRHYDIICCCVGTGGTLAGISNAAAPSQGVLGIVVHRDPGIKEHIRNFAMSENWTLNTDYHLGGYAKVNLELIRFMNAFKDQSGILLDPIYTGKMIFALSKMIENEEFIPGTKILVIHSGGQQGIEGMNQKLAHKDLPLINL